MANDIELSYRLPITFVRVVGEKTVTTDSIVDPPTQAVQSQAVVTTETGADLLSRIRAEIEIASREKQKSEWNLLPDGRLTGADVATTVDRYAEWAPYIKAGGFVLAAALPFLIPGPAGVIASVAPLSSTARGLAMLAGADEAVGDETDEELDPRMAAYLADVAHQRDALTLQRYRAALRDAEDGALEAAEAGDVAALGNARIALEIIQARTDLAEERYVAWLDSKLVRSTTEFDERFRADELPSKVELREWAGSPHGSGRWVRLAKELGTAVTIDLVDPWQLHSSVADRRSTFEPATSRGSIWWRRPRSAEVITWRVTAAGDDYSLEQVEVQRLLIAYPGNETSIPLTSTDGTTRSVAATFDASGALTKLVTDLTGVAQQRSADVGSLLTGIKDATSAGQEVGKALTPPSLVDQAAAAEAAATLAPASEDPKVKAMKKRIAAAELRARLRIAQQLATAESSPVVVRFEPAS